MSACEDGHTTQPCPGCGTCIRWQSSYGTTPKVSGWVEHDGTPHRCRTTSGVARLIEAARKVAGDSTPFPGPGTLTAVATTSLDSLRAALGALP